MLRISYVIGKERTARSRGQGSRIKEKYIMVDNVGMMVDNVYIRQNEKCAFYKTKSATKFQKQQTPIAKVCCFF